MDLGIATRRASTPLVRWMMRAPAGGDPELLMDRTPDNGPGRPQPPGFSDFIRERMPEILQQWEGAVRELPRAGELDRPALLDHVPELLDRIAEIADDLVAGGESQLPPQAAEQHALERLDAGFDLAQVVAELAILRDCVVQLWAIEIGTSAFEPMGLRALNQAIDRAVAASVDRYTQASARTLRSLDRISAAALEAQSLDEFLQRLLQVLLETTAAVDTATILLRDGDLLTVRASEGLDPAAATGFSLRVGEGFAGTIAESKQPHALRWAAMDRLALDPSLRAKDVKAIYGIPLVDGNDVIGVAHMGSLTAHDFSDQDKRLLIAMANRATAAILQHLLRETAERRARQQEAIASFGQRAPVSRDIRSLLEDAVRVVADALDVELVSALELVQDHAFLVRATHGWDPSVVEAVIPAAEDSHAGYTLKADDAVIVEDVATETRFRFPLMFEERRVRSGVSIPIRLPGEPRRIYGILGAHTPRRRAFSRNDVDVLRAVANTVGTAIALRLLEAERTNLLEEAQAGRAELEAVIESIPDAVFIRTDRGVIRCNSAALQLLGSDATTGSRQPVADLMERIHARDLETGALAPSGEWPFIDALRGERNVRDVALTDIRSGTEVVVRCSAAPIYRSVRVVGAVSVNTDITTRRRAEESEKSARTAAERALAVVDALLSSSLIGFAFIDTELRYVRINDALADLNGRPTAEHIGHTVREMIGHHADLVEPVLRKVIETGEAIGNLEWTAAPPSTPDRVRSWLANYFPVRTPGGVTIGVGAAAIEITERKQTEKALLEKQAQFRTLADNIPQLAWMADETGQVFWYNQRWHEYTGMTLEELGGWDWHKVHHPDHAERVTEEFRRCIAAGEAWEDDFPLRGKDGQFRWFLSRALPIQDGQGRVVRWFGTSTDITEQRLLAEVTSVLASSLDYHETLVQMAQLAVPAMADGCVVDVVEEEGSARTVKRVAVAHSEPAKLALLREYSRKYAPQWNDQTGIPEVIRTGRPVLAEVVTDEHLFRAARDQEQLGLLRELGIRAYAIVPLVARGRTLGAIKLIHTESGRQYRRVDLDLLKELARRAAIAVDNARLYEEAQRAVRMREDVLAVVSHDLKNPLGAIQIAAAMLLRKPAADPSARKQMEIVHRAASRMDHLIGDLLDVAGIQAGRLVLERKPEDLDALIAEAIEMHEPAAKEKGVRIVRVCELQGRRFSCDRDRIMQVFGNLLGNAVKFCGEGDLITIRGEVAENEARFAVADTGPGITESELPHIFEPYWSAKQHVKKGTGLGLYISKGIIEAHGGRLWVESKPGEGATFHFTLPLTGAAEDAGEPPAR